MISKSLLTPVFNDLKEINVSSLEKLIPLVLEYLRQQND